MFIDSGRIIVVLGNKSGLIKQGEELKIYSAKDELKKLIAQAW